ncbi:hypothetical protein CCACVL1_30113 [Corchorus capsularis]|uniref:Uncharacterized protein n=1 Tax=Corchorus capsularis TaxID=210143 RepID=A0A1R3FYM7_COCAP|nr:hypothetical protein CCACVL1_30113 [Corchorus capsularis]
MKCLTADCSSIGGSEGFTESISLPTAKVGGLSLYRIKQN